MSIWRVWGGVPLRGSVTVPGSASAALAVLAACALTDGEAELTNVPALPDTEAALAALRRAGFAAERRQDVVSVCRDPAAVRDLPAELTAPLGETERLLLRAAAERTPVTIPNASPEPETAHFCRFMQSLGADMDGVGSETVTLRGFTPARRIGWRVMPDRIAACAVMCACAAAVGDVELRGVEPACLRGVTDALAAMGARTDAGTKRLRICRPAARRLRGGETWVAGPYPGLPSQALPLLMAASLRAEGITVFAQTGRWDSFHLASECERMGAAIRPQGRVTAVTGVERLTGAAVTANGWPEALALFIAALQAGGQTNVSGPGQEINGLDGVLAALDARIQKIK